MKLASGFCIPEPLPVHTGIKGQQVHPLIRFLLRSRVDEMCADLHKPFIFYLFLVGVTVQSSESFSAVIPLGTSTKRANSKRANHGRSRLFQDAVPSVSFWLRSFPVRGWHDHCLQCLGIQHAEDAFVDDSCACCGCMSMTSLRSRLSFLKGLAPSAATRVGLSRSSRGPLAGALGDLRVTSKSFSTGYVPTDLLLLTQRTSRPVPRWFRWFVPRGTQHFIRCAIWGQDVDRSIGGWAYILWGWRCGGAGPLGCCCHRRTGARADGHACPGSCPDQFQYGGQQTAQSRTLEAGWLVSRSGAWLTTAFCSGAFFPGGAWRADEVVDGPFHGQKPLVHLFRPHYPRRRGCQGVRGHSPGGESGRGAPVPTKCRHLEELSASPVQSL